MAELLIKAKSANHENPAKDQSGCYKRGMIVEVRPDGANYGRLETWPSFVIIKIPLVSVDKVNKYMGEEGYIDGENWVVVRRRRWQIRWDDLPAGARTKLVNPPHSLTIKATSSYTGEYDYTWAQVKSYWRDLQANQDETEDLE